ncbi:MAG: oxidoreductase, partial [Candidatus Saccharimonadales bacterium]
MAIAVILTALGANQTASWWVGTAVMLPFILIGGLMIARKTRRGIMVSSFFLSVALATIIYSLIGHASVFTNIKSLVTTSAIFFLGFIMLTEPYTSPSAKGKQVWYAALVGALFPPQVHIARYYTSPEIALGIGNIFTALFEPKKRLLPKLKQKHKISSSSAEFVFDPGSSLNYKPGQYMEWTLPHDSPDNRGDRRYFTLSSSPTERDIKIGVKFYDPSSSFKIALLNIESDTPIAAAKLGGDFTLPDDLDQSLVFIAGGIGITPFRSMIKYLIDMRIRPKSLTLLYAVNNPQDIAYRKLLDSAADILNMHIVYVLAAGGNRTVNTRPGLITADLIY